MEGGHFMHGPMSTRQAFIVNLAPSPLYNRLVLRNLKHWFHVAPFDNELVPRISHMFSIGKCIIKQQDTHEDNITYCCFELLAAHLPEEVFLQEGPARISFLECAKAFLERGVMGHSVMTQPMYLAHLVEQQGGNIYHYTGTGAINAHLPNDEVAAMPSVWPLTNVQITALTFNQAYLILTLMAKYPTPEEGIIGLNMIAHTTIALAKQGTVSQAFCAKINRAIRSEMLVEFRLESRIVKTIWGVSAQYVNDTVAHQVLDEWLAWIPADALRLRVTMEQAADAGLTQYMTIKTAMYKFPGFGWGIVADIIPEQVAAYHTAVTAVGTNRYYGFKRDLGVVKSTNYPSLAYVAKELMIKVDHDREITGYEGWDNAPPKRVLLDEMIVAYERGLVGALPAAPSAMGLNNIAQLMHAMMPPAL